MKLHVPFFTVEQAALQKRLKDFGIFYTDSRRDRKFRFSMEISGRVWYNGS